MSRALNKLTARAVFRRIFHALCDYHEGAEASEKLF